MYMVAQDSKNLKYFTTPKGENIISNRDCKRHNQNNYVTTVKRLTIKPRFG